MRRISKVEDWDFEDSKLEKFHEIESYLHISNFVVYILEFKDVFIQTDPDDDGYKDDVFDYITDFLIKTQLSIDLPKVSRILIENDFHKQFIGVLEANDFEVDDFETRQKFETEAATHHDLVFYTPTTRKKFIK